MKVSYELSNDKGGLTRCWQFKGREEQGRWQEQFLTVAELAQ